VIADKMKELKRVTTKPFFIYWAHSKPQLYLQTDNGNIPVSPRLNIDLMEQWLEAFIIGYQMGGEQE